jgi:DNA repair protein RecO
MQTFRTVSTPAIVIRRERTGESHKGLVLLAEGLGLVRATAYGAWKMHSTLRLGSEPFVHSLARLYHDPVKNSWKVTDLEVRESFEGLRTDLARMEAASLWVEVVQKSLAAGETAEGTSGGLFRLLLACLRALESSGPERAVYATAQFLWRFLDLAGYRPDPRSCERCGRSFRDTEGASWLGESGTLACTACAGGSGSALSAGARRYLEATRDLDLAAALAVSLDAASIGGLDRTLAHAIRGVLETDLSSLRARARHTRGGAS